MASLTDPQAAPQRSRHRTSPAGARDVTRRDAVPCPDPACTTRGWPTAIKPRNWPWADRCWNCDVALRAP